MRVFVFLQCGFLNKTFPTISALQRLLPSVSHFVVFPIIFQMESLLAKPALELLSVDVNLLVSLEKDQFRKCFAAVLAMVILLLVSAHHVSFEKSLMSESFVANVTNHVPHSSVSRPVSLSNMHLQRTLLGEYLAASFAHETDVMSTQTVLIQLKLQGKRVVAYATLKRTIAAMICHDVVVQRGDIVEESVAVLAGKLRAITTESFFRWNPVFLDLMPYERRPRPELKAANFAKGGRLRILLRFAFLEMTFKIITERIGPVAIGTTMRTDFRR